MDAMFESLAVKDSAPIAFLKRGILIFLCTFLLLGIVSSHRAYFQVRSLELRADDKVLRGGSVIQSDVISSGRTYVDLKLEMIQGAHAETLATKRVRGNEYGFLDPRAQTASLPVEPTPEILARFQNGAALLRATAYGHSQWTRTPPPVVREISVEIQHK